MFEAKSQLVRIGGGPHHHFAWVDVQTGLASAVHTRDVVPENDFLFGLRCQKMLFPHNRRARLSLPRSGRAR
jgi:hypothetical protein